MAKQKEDLALVDKAEQRLTAMKGSLNLSEVIKLDDFDMTLFKKTGDGDINKYITQHLMDLTISMEVPEADDEEGVAKIREFIQIVGKVSGSVDAWKEEIKRPVLIMAKKIDAYVKELTTPIDDARAKAKSLLDQWEQLRITKAQQEQAKQQKRYEKRFKGLKGLGMILDRESRHLIYGNAIISLDTVKFADSSVLQEFIEEQLEPAIKAGGDSLRKHLVRTQSLRNLGVPEEKIARIGLLGDISDKQFTKVIGEVVTAAVDEASVPFTDQGDVQPPLSQPVYDSSKVTRLSDDELDLMKVRIWKDRLTEIMGEMNSHNLHGKRVEATRKKVIKDLTNSLGWINSTIKELEKEMLN